MNTTGPLTVSPQAVQATSTTSQGLKLGTRATTRDGRGFVWARAGAAPLEVGKVCAAAAQIALHQNTTAADAAIGARAIRVTPGATAGAENLYADGWAVVNAGAGLGQQYGIAGHGPITASVAFDLVLAPDDTVRVALATATSKVDLVQNPANGVLTAPTALTSAVVGVAVAAVAANEYCWLQVRGPAAVLIDGTPAVGNALSPSGAVAGAAAINAGTGVILGSAMVTGVGGRYQIVNLTLG